MIIVYFGNGKGKTTAALGLAIRSCGYKKKILLAQFIKSPKSITGEDKALKKFKNLTQKKFGIGFVGLFDDKNTLDSHRKAAERGFEYVLKNKDKFEVIILDEILGAIKGDLIRIAALINLIKTFPKDKDLVITGRPRFKKIIDLANLVTEMKEVKHPFRRGQMAKRGVDY